MGLTVHLLGRPRIDNGSADAYQFRSRKSWALLAVLVLTERPLTRSQLAALLFGEADDPQRALRWALSEIRRGLGAGSALSGDPVTLDLGHDVVVDVSIVMKGAWADAITLPGLGADLLDGMVVQSAAGFDSWWLSEQRYVAAASESILHEAAVGMMSRGDLDAALGFAIRAAVMSPLDENHQALLIRLYRLIGDSESANRQLADFERLCREELGGAPGPAVYMAAREALRHPSEFTDAAAVEAIVEAGSAAVSAGAVGPGIQTLRTAVELADRGGVADLRVRSRLVLAEALVHSLRGFDEDGVAALIEAADIAGEHGDRSLLAQARAELGYIDFLRARYDRSRVWLAEAIEFADGSDHIMAKATTYLGSVESDCANYPEAERLLRDAIVWSKSAGDQRAEAYASSLLGRIGLLRDDASMATEFLDVSIDLAERSHWLSFLPWPQALKGTVELGLGDVDRASGLFTQAFARACQLGDPCWEGTAARGLGLVAEAKGETDDAFARLLDARERCNRLADPYVWLDAYILDGLCELGLRHGHLATESWIDEMGKVASRGGMKELTVRNLIHASHFGRPSDATTAALLAAEIDNTELDRLLIG